MPQEAYVYEAIHTLLACEKASGQLDEVKPALEPLLRELRQPAQPSNISRRLTLCRQALTLLSQNKEAKLWAMLQNELGNALTQTPFGVRSDNIEQAIGAYRQALQVRTLKAMPVPWAQTVNNLGVAYYLRIRGDRAQNLEFAIAAYKAALEIRTRQILPIQWARTKHNLALALEERIRGEPEENIEQAIAAYKQALQVRTPQALPIQWAETMNNLANVYFARIRGEQAENLEQGIATYKAALKVRTRQTRPIQWAETMNNLANAYYSRIEGDRCENLEQAIAAYKAVLDVRTRQAMPIQWAETMNNLANAYCERMRESRAENLEQAIATYQQALEVQTLTAMPNAHYRTQSNLGDLYFSECQWPEAHTAYAAALTASDLLIQASATPEARQAQLREASKLFARAAYCLAHARFSEAVTTLEQSKARALSEALTRQEAVLERASSPDQAAFTAARERISELEAEARAEGEPWAREFLAVSADLHQARQELSAIVARIRKYVADFMPEGLDFPDIMSLTKTHTQPLVYLLTTSHGSLALIVSPNPTSDRKNSSVLCPIWLDDFQTNELNHILYDQDNRKRYLYGTVLAKTNREIQAFKQVLDDIWPLLNKLMAPIATRLQELGYQQAVLIPTGTLCLLPLHAISPQINFTYAPSGRAFQTVLNDHNQLDLPPALLGIGNPLPTPQPLPFARMEVEEIAPLFAAKSTFYEETATREEVVSHLRGTTHLHFSCHGTFDIDNPLNSALYLADSDTLTLRDLLDGNLDVEAIRLVILSACQTGITDFENVPDEAIGFPAGFLQAGVPAVISTLWPVADISTALLLARFYRYHLEDGLVPSVALWQALHWLREVTAGELAKYFAKKRRKRGATRKQASAAWRRFAAMEPDTQPFAHPHYWAAFTFTGV